MSRRWRSCDRTGWCSDAGCRIRGREETHMAYRLGVDVGGTFTDVQMQDVDTGEVTLVKALSTPGDQSVGVLEGVREACRRVGATPQDLDLILHGSTVVTNLVLEGKGARCGL